MTVLDDARLETARQRGDPPLDDVLAPLHGDAWRAVAALRPLRADDDPLPTAVPRALHPFAVPQLPSWVCAERIRRAQRFADRHLPQITVALFCAALPVSYTSVPGARVLALTGRLREDIDIRVNETARFVLDVLARNGFDPGGRGRLAVGRVRLVHAAVRGSVLALPSWRSSFAEVPVNQEDLLGALCLFSVVVLQSLERLGVVVDLRDRDDFVHLWAAVGAMLGIEDDLLPHGFAAAEATTRLIGRRQMRGSEDGRALMRALLDGMRRHVTFPGVRDFPAQLTAHLVGPERARMLGLSGERTSTWALGLGRSVMRLPPIRGLTAQFGRTLLEIVNDAKLDTRR
jgi:hypothetical protein